jgi:hypothetical protein
MLLDITVVFGVPAAVEAAHRYCGNSNSLLQNQHFVEVAFVTLLVVAAKEQAVVAVCQKRLFNAAAADAACSAVAAAKV